MTQKKILVMIFLTTFSALHLLSDVPPARLHLPDVPYFLKSMDFRTLKMQIFPERYAGMVVDSYGDLFMNPAFILRQSKKSVYLDFNVQDQALEMVRFIGLCTKRRLVFFWRDSHTERLIQRGNCGDL